MVYAYKKHNEEEYICSKNEFGEFAFARRYDKSFKPVTFENAYEAFKHFRSLHHAGRFWLFEDKILTYSEDEYDLEIFCFLK